MKTDHAILITGTPEEKMEKIDALNRLMAIAKKYGFEEGKEDLKRELRDLLGATSMDDIREGLSGHD